MDLFNDANLIKLEQQYKNAPPTPFYNLSTKPHNAELRIRIEEWLLDIPQPSAMKLVRNFKANHQATSSYLTELMVGAYLARYGYQVEYDKNVLGLTPDWCIAHRNQKPAIVEVMLLGTPEELRIEWSKKNEISSEVSKLTYPVAVGIEAEDYYILDSEFSTELDAWLSKKPEVGTCFYRSGIAIQVVHYNDCYSHTQTIGPGITFWGLPKRLENRLLDKALKYKKITDSGIPYVLAIFNDGMSSVCLEDLHKIVYGKDVEDWCLYQDEGIRTQYCELNGVYYGSCSNLHGVLWIEGTFLQNQITFLSNGRVASKIAI